MIYIWVGLAGALGAICRYLLGIILFSGSSFPFATLIINLLGTFLLAWLTTVIFSKGHFSPRIPSVIGTGFVGSFTTFSAFSVETVELFENYQVAFGSLYILLNMFGGIFMSKLGFRKKPKGDE